MNVQVRLGGAVSLRFPLRTLVITLVLVVVALAGAVAGLAYGKVQVSAVDVVRTILGQTTPALETVITEWRLPRVLLGLLLGAALGVAGAIFQSLTRNPLGSPDIIGFDAGAYAGAVLTIVIVGSTALVLPGALIGGIATALVVYLLAYRRGMHGFRLIIVGIGVTAMLGSVTTYLLLKAPIQIAQMAAIWGAGSLNGLAWPEVRLAVVGIAAGLAVLLCFGRGLAALELGDDAAAALGVPVERTRLGLLVGGTMLTATVTAVAGPITFVALAAPQLARRLTRSAGVRRVPSAAMGACLVVVADFVAQHAFPALVPVGLVTIVAGGAYLVWVLLVQARKEIR
ncbi:FecCD family ABC transporter permease [Pimelobacter simplex]|uniref:ABC-type Fe3+-siderophore transport system, permease 2 component n=1 Tax=Nocardioides simplex TaxID=2045 RepID=A0A0A1DNE0_NOCSI|nr:iron chelate uptake ABC transporter family permease subunit [Pimelobacter simplex]AIY18152.1 ABC-type Fe3+-siderophore transport system, permease 2 component [Pimelobacter simplex]GEB15731.1 iron-enterobactin transporter permease [Pimelobacter simplex]SFN09998.1 iron complex transport system permease protein [Pimelobacter simplex]